LSVRALALPALPAAAIQSAGFLPDDVDTRLLAGSSPPLSAVRSCC